VRKARVRRTAICAFASAHEALSGILQAYVAGRVLWYVFGASLDRDRDGLLIFFVGVILFCASAAVYFLADLLVAAAPVV